MDTPFMLGHFGWRAAIAIAISTVAYYLFFRNEFASLDGIAVTEMRTVAAEDGRRRASHCCRSRRGSRSCTSGFMAWTVVNAHYPALFIGGFLFFLGFTRATAAYQAQLDIKTPLLVGFFLAGLVIHGGLQGWWIAPVLSSLSRGRAVLGRHRPDRIQRQRAHHISRDARA